MVAGVAITPRSFTRSPYSGAALIVWPQRAKPSPRSPYDDDPLLIRRARIRRARIRRLPRPRRHHARAARRARLPDRTAGPVPEHAALLRARGARGAPRRLPPLADRRVPRAPP